ncbi:MULTISPECIES: hypothetical protein [Porphyromonas]|uniref:hypothetical protein n=1 Tax=Porphyromonas TaxID=836 RepID=UPI0003740782|nr:MULTISPECIES: hypothetical protein [Porphyromonas]ATR92395.1 hypothetical protein CS545_04430 [Porphyromonas gingivalis]ATS07611.1 hypothetical protein CS388_00150 [Porphyromonas gingivalis]KGN68320.1 hypothetical protein HR09_08090 [Porphyromonas gulae]KGN80895.1 hypothetical protein HR13_02690 [Porphyromonas gulae]
MEKYKVDYRESSPFKGITILFDYLEEGLDHAQQNNIKDVCVRRDINDNKKKCVDFSFLKNRRFIETFHWLVPLSPKSDIEGLYCLSNLKNLRCGFNVIDLSNFSKLEILNIGYHPKVTGWENLNSLKRLVIGGVESEDLSFLSQTDNLEFLRIIRGTFTSIKGLEKCNRLKTLFIQSCNSLVHVKETVEQMKSIENFLLEKCKNVDLRGIEQIGLKNISVI